MKSILWKTVLTGIAFLFIISCTSGPEEDDLDTGSQDSVDDLTAIEDSQRPLEERLDFYQSPEDASKALDLVEALEERTQEEERLYLALLVTEQRFDEAIFEGDRLLDLFPEDLEIIYLRALTAYQVGDEDTLEDLLAFGLELDPEDGQMNLLKSIILVDARRYSQANQALSLTLNRLPDHFQALILKSDVLMHLGKGNDELNETFLKEAVKVLTHLEEIAPDYPYTYVDRAKALVVLGEAGEAYQDLTKAIELQPHVEWHYIDRARVTLKYMNDLDGALEDLIRCEEINPDNFLAMVYMAGIYFDKLDFEKSLSYYSRVVKQNPDYLYAFESLGALNYTQGNFAEAKAAFLKAYDQYDDNEGYILMAALAMKQMGEFQEANQLLTQVARSLDRDSLVYEVFRYYLEGGSDYFVQEKIRKEEDEYLRNRCYYYLGELYLTQDSLGSATICFENASNLSQVYEGIVARWRM